ncbi:hypothetical protein ABEW34_12380 [Paenibacillus algorifonticola]|uniref:hypothetical protein n=1 Tax=Paenibacillus algorifonticola TaxID=684063 RepID=UPI003D2B95F4
MSEIKKIENWLEEGKQLGINFSFENNGKKIWSSVAIQKWNNIYKAYIDEIEEDKMDSEEYRREEIHQFENLNDAFELINKTTLVNLNDLAPCKGQKIFNPSFD